MPHDGARRDSLLFGDNLVDLSGARELAARDKHQFQWWAVSLVDAVPQGGKKKGADRGIDGIRWVRTGPRRGDLGQMIVSVKGGGNVSVRDVRDLAGTVERRAASSSPWPNPPGTCCARRPAMASSTTAWASRARSSSRRLMNRCAAFKTRLSACPPSAGTRASAQRLAKAWRWRSIRPVPLGDPPSKPPPTRV